MLDIALCASHILAHAIFEKDGINPIVMGGEN